MTRARRLVKKEAKERKKHEKMGWSKESKIHIRGGQAKPIDLLAKYISTEGDDLSLEMHEPYTFLNGLTVPDKDDLLEEIKMWALQLEDLKYSYK
ncbi:hypothetical protein Q7C36_000335 [Tachysurus vachellii]|uniref:Splicing factor cactin central domain-containing protein n=1 Tax=Tachysurus vachellii TaxID=175792 RepID=A0AA88P9Q6_TACVA|nr:hypothetical protein Q7C36_000335 [Tachysurus vachellii]